MRRARQLESGARQEAHQGKAGGGEGQGQDRRGGLAGMTSLYPLFNVLSSLFYGPYVT